MNELKPLATTDEKQLEYINSGNIGLMYPQGEHEGRIKLYAIPDTHRVVSVEDLRGIQSAFFEAEEDVRDWGAYASEYMQTKHGLDEQALVYKRMAESLSAIIDNKEPHNE